MKDKIGDKYKAGFLVSSAVNEGISTLNRPSLNRFNGNPAREQHGKALQFSFYYFRLM
jgi:hypothetical protein